MKLPVKCNGATRCMICENCPHNWEHMEGSESPHCGSRRCRPFGKDVKCVAVKRVMDQHDKEIGYGA